MKKYAIRNQAGEIISRHKSLDLANQQLRTIDSVHSTLHATDVDWLNGYEEALQGYNYTVGVMGHKALSAKI